VLRQVSATLEQEFSEGLVFRVYGDDFVVLFESHVDFDDRLAGLKSYLDGFGGLGFKHSHIKLTREMLSSVEELDRLLTDTVYRH
jgi:GGDEF domain-containing protein